MKQVSSLGNNITVYVQEEDDAGTIAIYPSSGAYEIIGELDYQIFDTSVLIKNVEVKEEYRGQGIGSQLYKILLVNHLDKYIDWGITTVYGAELKACVEDE